MKNFYILETTSCGFEMVDRHFKSFTAAMAAVNEETKGAEIIELYVDKNFKITVKSRCGEEITYQIIKMRFEA